MRVNHIKSSTEQFLRKVCGGINPKSRVYIVAIMCFAFFGIFCYTFLHSIHDIKKGEVEFVDIQHIESLDIAPSDSTSLKAIDKSQNNFEYE